jgi:hypothetical protein
MPTQRKKSRAHNKERERKTDEEKALEPCLMMKVFDSGKKVN